MHAKRLFLSAAVTAALACGCTPGGNGGDSDERDRGPSTDGGLDGSAPDVQAPDAAPPGPSGSWVELRPMNAERFSDLAWFDGQLFVAGSRSVTYDAGSDTFAPLLQNDPVSATATAAGAPGAYFAGPERFYFPFQGTLFYFPWQGQSPFTGGLSLAGEQLFGGTPAGLVQWSFGADGAGMAPTVAAGDILALAALTPERVIYALSSGIHAWNPVQPAELLLESAPDEAVRSLHALDADFIVGVGDGGVVHTFANGTWQTTRLPEAPALTDVYARAADDIWAVGRAGFAAHFDGAEWTPIETPTAADLTAVVAPDDGLWIAAADGALHWFGPEDLAPAPLDPEPEPEPEPEPQLSGHLRVIGAGISVRLCNGNESITRELSTGDVVGYMALPPGGYGMHTDVGPQDQCGLGLDDSEVRFNLGVNQGVTVLSRSFSFGGTASLRDDATAPADPANARLRVYSWFQDGAVDVCVGDTPLAAGLGTKQASEWSERAAGEVEIALHTPADPPCSGAQLTTAPIELIATAAQTLFLIDPTNRSVEEVSFVTCVDSVEGVFGQSFCRKVTRDL